MKYEVKSLIQSVQNFCNGRSVDIVIDHWDKMDEVVELLGPLIQRTE